MSTYVQLISSGRSDYRYTTSRIEKGGLCSTVRIS